MEDKEINSQDFSAEDFNDIENQEILAQNMQSMESSLFEENANILIYFKISLLYYV